MVVGGGRRRPAAAWTAEGNCKFGFPANCAFIIIIKYILTKLVGSISLVHSLSLDFSRTTHIHCKYPILLPSHTACDAIPPRLLVTDDDDDDDCD